MYSMGNYAALPANDNDLETLYSAGNVTDVATDNDVRVGQAATDEYAIHEYKDFVNGTPSVTIEWQGQTNLLPSLSTVYLQIYNHDTDEWETVDSDNTSAVDTDFTLTSGIADVTDYKDSSDVISCRVYQLAI